MLEIPFDLPAIVSADFGFEPGYSTITISRCGEFFVKVDPEALELLKPYTWSKHSCGKGKIYARATRSPYTGDYLRLYMHRFIAENFIGPAPSAKHVVDHKNGDGLDNRVENLRWLDAFENRWKYARHKCAV